MPQIIGEYRPHGTVIEVFHKILEQDQTKQSALAFCYRLIREATGWSDEGSFRIQFNEKNDTAYLIDLDAEGSIEDVFPTIPLAIVIDMGETRLVFHRNEIYHTAETLEMLKDRITDVIEYYKYHPDSIYPIRGAYLITLAEIYAKYASP